MLPTNIWLSSVAPGSTLAFWITAIVLGIRRRAILWKYAVIEKQMLMGHLRRPFLTRQTLASRRNGPCVL